MENREEKLKSLSFKELFAFVLRYVDSYSLWIALIFILVLYVVLGRSLPILFGNSIDHGIIPEDLKTFRFYCLLFLGAGVGRALVGFALYYLVRKESNRISYNVRKHIFNHVLSLGIRYFDKNPSGKILTRVANDTRSFQTLLGDGVVGILISALELISILAALAYESVALSLIVFVSFPLSVFIGFKLAKIIQEQFFEMKNLLSSINTYLADSLNGFYVIKTYRQFDLKFENFKSSVTEYFNRQMTISKIYALLWPQLDLFQLLTSVVCFAVGAYLIQKGQLQIGSLVAFTLLIQGFFHPLRFILESINQVQNGLTSSKRIDDVLQEKPEPGHNVTTSNSKDRNFVEPSIEIRNLDFSYEPGKEIFRNYNLKIPPYSLTALTGRTGSGKTTLVSLMQKLYEPDGGQIFVCGRELSEISNKELRKRLCVVRQEDFIFSGTLAENIALKEKDIIDMKKAQDALDFAGIEKSLLHKIESSGGNLSPGERQLLSFARIHYLSPEILIFDEATSFIDEETEEMIQKKSKTLFDGKTVIIIAHKKTTIEMCDEVVAL